MTGSGVTTAIVRSATLVAWSVLAACGSTNADPPPTLDDVIDRPLDTLSGTEGQLLCEAERARTDECQKLAMQVWTEASCSETLSSCKSANLPTPSCHAVDFGPPGTCSVTVGEYLTCIDAWNATQTCDNADALIPTPDSCKQVVGSCIRFADDFHRDGKPPKCQVPAAPLPPDTNDDIYGADGCRPLPKRFVVLGDSIAACFGENESCTSSALVEHLNAALATDLVVESHAVSGAFTAELPAQAAQVQGGPGHVLVYTYMIGNDLATDNIDWGGWFSAWNQVFAYFTDTTRFPDGATFLLNTQYSPYDQCPNPPGPTDGISLEQEAFLQDVNRTLFLDVAQQRTDTVAIDHYPDFLGHGRNANIQGCHCQASNSHWLSDGIHPNSLGYEHMTAKWIVAFDAMYGPSCGS
jgi:hypothetical protein